MQARRPSSKKWTHFPKEFTEHIESAFLEGFGEKIKDFKLLIEGRVYPEELVLRVGLLEPGRLKQANFEVSADYQSDEEQVLERIHTLVDVAASMMVEYIETDGVVEFPFTWKDCPFDGKTIYLQYNTENSALEAQANALLGVSEDAMFNEESTSEDVLDRAEKNNLH